MIEIVIQKISAYKKYPLSDKTKREGNGDKTMNINKYNTAKAFGILLLMQGLTPCEAVPFRSPYLHPEGIIYRFDNKISQKGTQKAIAFKSPYRAGSEQPRKARKLTSAKNARVQKKPIEQMILEAEKEYQKELPAYTLDRKLDREIAELEREIKKDQIELERSEGKRKKLFGIF